jgi:hypothetical protein
VAFGHHGEPPPPISRQAQPLKPYGHPIDTYAPAFLDPGASNWSCNIRVSHSPPSAMSCSPRFPLVERLRKRLGVGGGCEVRSVHGVGYRSTGVSLLTR